MLTDETPVERLSARATRSAEVELGEDDRDLARWCLGGPLTGLLVVVALAQAAAWLPHYLTWPYWADHDVFATAARGWTQGVRPYRDLVGNNFPGTIYLFLVVGASVGWGRPWGFYALDALLLFTLVATMLVWSRRRFGTGLPGIIGGLAFMSYALSLDYCHAAQRDWQGPAFFVLSILVLQISRSRAATIISALLAAFGFAIRPQVALFLPAAAFAAFHEAEDRPRRIVGWAVAFGVGVFLAFLPLMLAGVFDDFLAGVRLAASGRYNKATPITVARDWLLQASAWQWLVIPAAIGLLGAPFDLRAGRTAGPWLLALAGASLYRPLSPQFHSYLEIPLVLIGAINQAVLAGLVLHRREAPPRLRLVGVLLILALGGATLRPGFCVAGPTVRAVAALARGEPVQGEPPGYRKSRVGTGAYYPWVDYAATLDYLRRETTFSTRVANLLDGDPAVAGMVDRLPALPAESSTWLRMVRPEDEPRFVTALEDAGDSVVLWNPDAPPSVARSATASLAEVVRRRYHPEARFGDIAVWRRNAP